MPKSWVRKKFGMSAPHPTIYLNKLEPHVCCSVNSLSPGAISRYSFTKSPRLLVCSCSVIAISSWRSTRLKPNLIFGGSFRLWDVLEKRRTLRRWCLSLRGPTADGSRVRSSALMVARPFSGPPDVANRLLREVHYGGTAPPSKHELWVDQRLYMSSELYRRERAIDDF